MREIATGILQWTALTAIVALIVVFIWELVFAFMDFTRKVEDPIGSLTEEEKHKEDSHEA